MQKISSSTATANGAGEFTQGQPGSGIDATMITVAWLNAMQRELVNLVQGSGQDLKSEDDGQVLKAVKMLQELASSWDKITGKPTSRDGYKLSDVFTKAETGTVIQNAVAALVASSPAALDTLKELADALGNDPNFAVTVANSIAGKMPVAGGDYSPSLSSLRINRNYSAINSPGGFIVYGPGDGGLSKALAFICNRSDGTGGFSWRTVSSDNTWTGPSMTYSAEGILNVPSLVITGTTSVPTQTMSDSSSSAASTAFVKGWTSQYPTKDWISAVGLVGGDKTAPYLRVDATGELVLLQTSRPKDTALLASSGWSKNADTGEIIQWVEYALSDSPGTTLVDVTWPFQFPNQCLNVRSSVRQSTGSSSALSLCFYPPTKAGCTVRIEEWAAVVQSGLVLMVEARGV
ncbi:gp53-like domain-containing protein [Pseudomonas costantinii]|uniref:Putative tail fiber protein gp53-like C-terminal domain-containing protein n=1 Tax=Pseudomonas costantinii TaxID=168469 RepID=A0A1S2UB41_9PSED|nr:hypothetical protein [Pseudomonas costantinii]OIN43326.1 hypothetical protein BFL40_32255 [Pseudomonas costantinii]SEE38394.1 hypothetical protein SAMN04515675_5243 [Pseudomonas costantinii]